MSYTNALFTAQVSHSRQSNLSFLTPQNSTTQYQQLHAHYKNASPSSTHQTAPLSIEQYAQQISGKSPFGTLVAARTTPHTRQVTIQRSPRCPNCSSIPPSSSSWSSLNIAHLPRDIDDCHIMIQSLRSQLVQSRGRAAALEDELSSYRDQSLALQLNSSTPLSSLASTVIVPTKTPLSPAPLKSSPKQLHENFGDVLTAMQRRVDEQSLEIQRLVEEKTDLKRAANEAAIEASLKLEAERTLLLDERIRYEKNQQELALKLGKEAALTAFAAASAATLKQDQEKPNIAHSLTTLEETKAYSINNNIGESTADHEGLETNKVQSKKNDQDDTIEGPLIPSAVSPKALSANELLVRHEHIRQQEMLILALKQQQQQTKALVLAQQRQQAMLDVQGITLGSSYGSGSSYASKSFENGIRGGFSNEEVYSEEPSSYRVPPIHPIQHQAQLRLQAATNKMLYTIAADQNQFNHHHQQQQQIIQQNEVSPSSISSSLTSSISNGGGQYGFNDRRLQSANIKNGLVEQSVNEGKSSRLRTRDSSDLPLDDKHIQPYQQQQQYVTPEQQQRIQIMQQQMNQRAAAAAAATAATAAAATAAAATASGTGNNTLVSNQQTTVSSTATNELVAISAPQSSSSSTVRTRQPATASSVSKNTANTTDFAANEVAEQRMQKAILMPSSPLAGIIPSRLFKFANVVELNEDLVSISLISGWIGLPPGATTIWCQAIVTEEPMMGYSIYQMPPEGNPWPLDIPFFAPLVAPGIPFIKHGRLGKPKKRVMFLDITNAADPTLMWHEGDFKDKEKVKAKDCLRLIDIADIRAGRSGAVLQRSGVEEHSGRYICFCSSSEKEGRTLDIELPSSEARDFLFRKFADLFQAYATAAIEKRTGDAANLRVAAIVDGGANSKPGSTMTSTKKGN